VIKKCSIGGAKFSNAILCQKLFQNQLTCIRNGKRIEKLQHEFDLPIITGMDFGHYTPNLPLPLGSEQA